MKKIIDVIDTNYLHLFLNNLIFEKDGSKVIIPTNNIDTLILENDYMSISLPLINKLIDNGVNLIVCDSSHLPNALLIPYQKYYSVKNLQTQINWNNEEKNTIWKSIIKQKILNSLSTLNYLKLCNKDDEAKLINYSQTIKYMDYSNNEAHAAKLYFKCLFGENFIRSDNDVEKNKYLNYGYAVLLSYVVRSLVAKGFDCRLGLFHKNYKNNFALATDVMEPLRCIVDLTVYNFFKNNELLDFADYKKELFSFFHTNIKVLNKTISIVEYINLIIEKFIKNQESEELTIDWGL
ncbi:type II CRISPR-associated endonuclease Cas1 [Mycoplasmopsis lipofaciens]|uniref:type II CRISPR-associated endonuclease Cas1 n=1 Tax=Mycoplasmopsis lipofaciens TaxID=114884 RepID=UPI000562B1E7|nr:type II CRISPR-associated endonuclease Cas1 [Mycoplasmopsis lipofaciens]